MRDHDINKKNNFISGWYTEDNLLSQDLINYYHADPNKRRGLVSGRLESNIKRSTDSILDNRSDLFRRFGMQLQSALNLYLDQYKMAAQGRFNISEPVNIQHYKPNEGFYAWHCERQGSSSPINNRHLVWMMYLNTVTDQGGTEFLYQNTVINAEKDLLIIWPTDWTHTHRGIPSPSQDKWIITGWLNFVA